MTKISLLTPVFDLDGNEQVVMVKDGVTRRAAVAGLVGAAVAPHVEAAELAASTALAASNYYGTAQYGSVAAAIAAGEAGTDLGRLFSVDDGAGDLIFRARTVDGSVQIAQAVTPTSLSKSTGARKVGVRQAGASAVTRTLEDMARDYLFAANYGVIGDGIADDTAASQNFLNECEIQNKVAYYGSLRVKVSGPQTSRVGIVFDGNAYGTPGDPGFYATGSGYTVITQLNLFVSQYALAIYGTGDVTYNQVTGAIISDTRTQVNGLAFGDPEGSTFTIGVPGDANYFVGFTDPFAAATVGHIRVFNLSGFGVKNTAVWDTTFLSVSVERCGNSDHYAFSLESADGSTCNESTWVRLQVERSIHKAIYISPTTLACNFLKMHIERQVAIAGVTTFFLGGSNTYQQVRAQAINGPVATFIVESQQADLFGFRGEDGLVTRVNASGGTVNLHSPLGIFQPVLDQTGMVNVFGGQVEFRLLQQGWSVYGAEVSDISCGFTSGDQHSSFHNCPIATFGPVALQATGALRFYNCQISGGRTIVSGTQQFRDIRFLNGTVFAPTGGAITFGYQNIVIDTTSRIEGNVTLDFATGHIDGKITGNLAVAAGLAMLAGPNAVVNGTISGWGAPSTGAHQAGEYTKNLQAPGAGGAAGYLCITDGTPGEWRSTGIVGGVQLPYDAAPTAASIRDALIASALMAPAPTT